MQKNQVRDQMRLKLSILSAEEREKRSLRIEEKLFHLEPFKKAQFICFYVSLATEVDTSRMIDKALAMGKHVLVPLSDRQTLELSLYQIRNRDALQKGAWGIFEPDPAKTHLVSPDKLDCILVPGVAFDSQHNRLGQGKGFYDRFLAKLSPKVMKIGLGFSFQKVESVPVTEHDVKLDNVIYDE